MDIFESLKSKISGKNLKIVFPEGEELRILKAVARLNEEKIITPVILGDEEKIKELAKKFIYVTSFGEWVQDRLYNEDLK